MNRRQFLAASAAAAAAGCSRSPSPEAATEALMKGRLDAERGEREKSLAELAKAKVPTGATFTTPKPLADVPAVFPDLKSLSKVAVRLHPRFSDEPGPDATKVGGRFLWPAAEAWPTDPERKVPLVGVIQVRAEDAPPPVQFPFRPGTDLLQVLWSPVQAGRQPPAVTLVWRERAKVGADLAPPPPTDGAMPSLLPVPCRAFPERVTEYPDWDTLSKTDAGPKVEGWKPPAALMDAMPAQGRTASGAYSRFLAAAHGTKVGGYPRWDGAADPQACAACKRAMDYLLTVDADEWNSNDELRWRPAEDAKAGDTPQRRATGLANGYHVYICRRCENWPAQAVLVG
jgi:hypothetical protein